MKEFSKELKVAIRAAKESGKVLMRYYRKDFRIERKADKTPVTIADKESEKKIVSIIRKHFPEHNFLCEEFSYKKTDSEYKWIIDPLDGTKEFVHGMPFFCNFIALEIAGKAVLGVLNFPAMKMFAYASKGRGSFINGKSTKVSSTNSIEESIVAYDDIPLSYERGHGKELVDLTRECKMSRGYGAGVGYLMLAQGSVDIVVDASPQPWDLAAAKIIIEEAGGKLTDLQGKETIYSRQGVATNGLLHDEVLKILRRGK